MDKRELGLKEIEKLNKTIENLKSATQSNQSTPSKPQPQPSNPSSNGKVPLSSGDSLKSETTQNTVNSQPSPGKQPSQTL